MAVVLPTGWTNFGGGGSDESLCGEDQDCSTPPCTPPPPTISGSRPNLSCQLHKYELTLTVSGGTPPFIWAAVGGQITVTGVRTATLSIHPDVGFTAYFKAYGSFILDHVTGGIQVCQPEGPTNPVLTDVVGTVQIRPYDCIGLEVERGDVFEALSVGYATPPWDHPVGEVVAKRSYTDNGMANLGVPTAGQQFPEDPEFWSTDISRCTDGSVPTVTFNFGVIVAGENGVNGTIWSGAPVYTDQLTMTFRSIPVGEYDGHSIQESPEAPGQIDVRTQAMVDTECCVIPSGSSVLVTVIDAEGNIALISIPVVDPS